MLIRRLIHPSTPRRVRRSVGCSIERLEERVVLSGAAASVRHAIPIVHPILDPVPPAAGKPASSPVPPAAATTPAQMRHFYGVDNINFGGIAGDGRGQTIAIVDAFDDPSALADLHNFDLYYGLPDPPSFQKMDEFGGTNYPSTDVAGPGSWEIEESLDVQWAHVIAPAANIVLIEADSASLNDLFQAASTAATLPGVVAVSMSFGADENGIFGQTSYDSTFLTPSNHQGVTFLAASGDGGSPGLYPAYSPNVVAVGGTAISFAPGTTDGTYGSETAWSGSGGGFSSVESKPSYQSFLPGNSRAIPDVSMDSKPQTGAAIYDSFDFGAATPWAQYGGTSLATPMWAGLIAIADQGRASAGLSSLDGRTQTLPALYSISSADYHDITSGSNGGFSATVGYDEVTGIGTPVANKLVNDLATVAPSSPQIGGSTGAAITIIQSPDHLYIDWVVGATFGQVLIGDTNGLTLNGDGGNDPILLDYSNGNPLPLKGTFTLNGLQGANPLAGRTIDINRSTLYINYAGGADPITAIAQSIQNGNNGGTWSNSTMAGGVITSSAAAANHTAGLNSTGIGYADSADGTGVDGIANTVELKYTLYGDANLSGNVDSADLQILLASLNLSGQSWDQGDFNYDGMVNSADLQTLLSNLNRALGSQAAPAPAPAVARSSSASPADDGSSPTLPIGVVTGKSGSLQRVFRSARRHL
jgi:hypothetical protein